MKIAILGASGILGQHLMISVPTGIEAVFTRRRGSRLYQALDLEDWGDALMQLDEFDVIINLAGHNSPDEVQNDPARHVWINSIAPFKLAEFCTATGKTLIHVSSQAVLDGCNQYGFQKAAADGYLRSNLPGANWTIVRPTFVLGIRPFPAIGRENPAERILAGRETHSVDNRYFAVSFAWDVAELLWRIAQEPEKYRGQEINAGNPERVSRYSLAKMLGANPEPITQEHAEKVWGIAPRPMDTSGAYAEGQHKFSMTDGVELLKSQYVDRGAGALVYKAAEVAAFLKIRAHDATVKLLQGFGPLHNAVTEDFNNAFLTEPKNGERFGRPPANDAELLEWYRTTDKYIYELSAYHCDPGFNYAGMCKGILETLKGHQQQKQDALDEVWKDAAMMPIVPPFRVLCLGDGIGSLTIALKEGGLDPVYHDLAGSRTAAFAAARFEMRFTDQIPTWLSEDFSVPQDAQPCYDAVVSLDFLEHVVNVEDWARFAWQVLKPGGLFFAQNAYGMGSGPDGAMPMHLACNDRFVTDWDPLLSEIGFVQLGSNNYERPL